MSWSGVFCYQTYFSNSGDSLVTNSLLGFTAPAVSSGRKRRDDEEKAQLSGYILDEGN